MEAILDAGPQLGCRKSDAGRRSLCPEFVIWITRWRQYKHERKVSSNGHKLPLPIFINWQQNTRGKTGPQTTAPITTSPEIDPRSDFTEIFVGYECLTFRLGRLMYPRTTRTAADVDVGLWSEQRFHQRWADAWLLNLCWRRTLMMTRTTVFTWQYFNLLKVFENDP